MFYRWLGDWLIRHRLPVVIALTALTIASALLIPRLQFDFSPTAMLEFDDEEEAFYDEFRERFGNDDNTFLVVIHGGEGDVLTPDGLELLYELTELLEKPDEVESTYSLVRVPTREISSGLGALLKGSGEPPPLVESLPVTAADAKRVKREVERSQVLPGNLVSVDGSTAMVIVAVKDDSVKPNQFDPLLESFEKTVPEVVAEHNAKSDEIDFKVTYGGLPYVRTLTIRNLKSEQLIFWPILGAIYFLLLLVVFRSIRLALMPLAVVGLATIWSVGLVALADIKINIINNSLPTLLLVVGVCNAIHVMTRILDERRAGANQYEAVRKGVEGVGLASLLTTLTTAIGFAALLVAHSDLLRSFGWLVASGIMLTYVAIITLLPVLATWIPLETRGERKRKEKAETEDTPLDPLNRALQALLETTTRWFTRGAIPVLVLAVASLAVCVYIGSRIPVDARVIDAFTESHPMVQSNRLIERKLGGILPLEIDMRGEPGTFSKAEALQRVARFEARAAKLENVLSTISLIDLLGEAGFADPGVGPENDAAVKAGVAMLKRFQPELLNRYATEDLSNVHVSIRMPDVGVQASLGTLAELKKIANEELGTDNEIQWRFTGVAYFSAIGLNTFVRDLFYSLVTATVIIFFVLIIVFRSVRVGLISLLPNLLPLAITLAMMPLFGYELNTTTVVVFTISIGLAVDNSIHIIMRFRQECARGLDETTAIEHTFRSAGRAIITSNLLLIAGFSVLLISDFEPLNRVAVLSMTSIGGALLASLIVLPAELKLFAGSLKAD